MRAYVYMALVASLASLCSVKAESVSGEATSAQFDLAEEQVAQLQQSALSGDSTAAVRLVKYYRFVRDDYVNDKYWLQIAAENGSGEAQADLGRYLINDKADRDAELRAGDRARACFWFARALKNGVAESEIYSGYQKECQ